MAKDNWIRREESRVCYNCFFYVEKELDDKKRKDVTFGWCRRHAPVVGEGFPAVFPTDWCGDHKLDENKI